MSNNNKAKLILKKAMEKMANKPEEMRTIREVAKLLHLASSTIRKWSDNGLFPAYHLGTRGDRRFKREDIDNFLENSKEKIR